MIEINNLEAGYSQSKVINKISLDFPKAEFCSILGPNGAGKSTLLKTLIRYLKPISGDIRIKKKHIDYYQQLDLAKEVSIIPQEYNFVFEYTVEEIAIMGRFPYQGYFQSYSKQDQEIMLEILAQLDLYHLRKRFISHLSGGEKQRVIIARALIQQTDIILMDEALSQIDINHQLDIMKLLSNINMNDNKLIVLISHNINLSAEFCDRLIFLKNGKVLKQGKPKEVITTQNLNELYEAKLELITNPFTGNPNIVYTK